MLNTREAHAILERDFLETRGKILEIAAATLGDASPALANPDSPLLPAWSDVPDVAVRIAHAVAVQAVADGVAPKRSGDELTERIAQVRWTPEYPAVPA